MEKKLTCSEYKEALKKIGVSYLGSTKSNPKIVKNTIKGNVITYSISLLQGNLSGYEVCKAALNSPCRALCLGFSGHAKASILAFGLKESKVVRARRIKTRLFFEDRDTFMNIMRYEIDKAVQFAKMNDCGFSVRINCMSDIDPCQFRYEDSSRNILDMYPDVVFYDYSKEFDRFYETEIYPNYHLTYSYDGKNWDNCVDMLRKGRNVAVVFESPVVPVAWRGYPVIDGTKTDLRYLDEQGGKIVYLLFHRPASAYKSGKYKRPDTPFVVREDDPAITYAFKVGKSDEE